MNCFCPCHSNKSTSETPCGSCRGTMFDCETLLLREEIAKLNLQNSAMRRALTDVMRFSTDDRSRGVASGILAAHGGADPVECNPLKRNDDGCARLSPPDIAAGTLTCNGKFGHKGRHHAYWDGQNREWD